MLSSKGRFVHSDFAATVSGPSPFFLDTCSQVASVCICLLCYSMRPAPGPVPPAAPGVPSGPSGTWTHIIETYKDDVERQVELSGDSDSAIRNSPRLVAPSKQTTADYSRLNFCLVPGKLLVLLILILSRAVLKLCFYQWRSPYAWGLYQEVQSCLLHRGSHLVRGGPQRRTDVHVYKLLTATCMFICHIVHHEKIFSLNSHGDIFAYISSLVFLICISCRTINKYIFVYLHVQLSPSWHAEFVNQQCANICYTHCLHKSWVLITVFPCALF